MQLTATILSSVAALAGTAAAQAPHAALDIRFPVPTAPPQQLAVRNMLQMRNTAFKIPASLTQCAQSMADAISAIPTPAPALASWASDNLMEAMKGGLCSATMPESLSADYHGYSSKIMSWFVDMSSTFEQVKVKCTEAQGENQPMTLAISCSAKPTIFWVNEEGKTRAEEQTVPTQLMAGGGASKGPATTGARGPASSTTGAASATGTGSASGAATAKASGTSPAAASAGSALRSAGLGMLVGAVAFAAVLL
ncbi:hypothetical protein RB595_000228 [Gaeumannomyces hyphopodioides]